MIDLHTHTTFSDGTDTPTQLINKALAAGITTIALTDHDSISG
jgi:predicted metal-dependent phosphoesterase TrpH